MLLFLLVLVSIGHGYQAEEPLSDNATLSLFPLLIVGKQRRLQFVECANDINAMIDAAKFADLVLLLTDGSYGFEMVCFCCYNFELSSVDV